MMDIVVCCRCEVSATSLFERSSTECVNECDHVQQRPTAATMSKQKQVTIRKKERQTDTERSIQIKCVESGKDCDKYKASCNVDMDGDTANLTL